MVELFLLAQLCGSFGYTPESINGCVVIDAVGQPAGRVQADPNSPDRLRILPTDGWPQLTPSPSNNQPLRP